MRTKEMLKLVGFKQREIEWLQEKGIVDKPTPNKYGHFEYTDDEVNQIWIVKFFKEVGYSNKEIKDILKSEEYNEKKALDDLIEKLELKIEKLENLITIAKSIRDSNENIIKTKFSFPLFDNLDFDSSITLLGAIERNTNYEKLEASFEPISISEDDYETFVDSIIKISKLCDEGKNVASQEVQNNIKGIHKVYEKLISDSILFFSGCIIDFAPKGELALEIDEECGEGKSKFIYDSLRYYCQNTLSETDKKLLEVINKIENLAKEKYKTNSKEVQEQVKIIHEIFNNFKGFSYTAKLELLGNFGKVFGSKGFITEFDMGRKKGIFWFVSRAIEIYINNLQEEE